MKFSIIIPVLNEEQTLRNCLKAVRETGESPEIIVVDGGSRDRTREIAIAMGASAYVSTPGRGNQQNSGVRVATGDIFLFLHADTHLPRNAFTLLRCAFENSAVQIGVFRSVFDSNRPALAL